MLANLRMYPILALLNVVREISPSMVDNGTSRRRQPVTGIRLGAIGAYETSSLIVSTGFEKLDSRGRMSVSWVPAVRCAAETGTFADLLLERPGFAQLSFFLPRVPRATAPRKRRKTFLVALR